MNHQILRKYFTVLSSCLILAGALILLWPPAQALACSDDGDCYNMDCYSFFAPEIIDDVVSQPFFLSQNPLYQTESFPDTHGLFQDINAEEWQQFFQKTVTAADITFLLYTASLKDIDALIFALKGKKSDLPPKLAAHSLLKYRDPGLASKALYYLGFAKRCEPIALDNLNLLGWEPKEQMDPARKAKEIQKLLDGGQKLLANATDPFLVQRYHFQILRLLFYAGNYAGCYDYYESNKSLFSSANSIALRAMSFAAGALYRQKRYGEANYLHSRLFETSPSFKTVAYLSFHPQEEADWQKSLALAKNNREKTVLWQLLGIYADGLRAMQEIYALDPKSDLLPLLLVREVNRQEYAVLFKFRYDEDKKKEVRQVPANLLAFLKKVADAGNSIKPELWSLAFGHLAALNRDRVNAEKYLEKAQSQAPHNLKLLNQARLSSLFAKVRSLSRPDPKMEPILARELTWLAEKTKKENAAEREKALFNWSRQELSELYRASQAIQRALMLWDNANHEYYQDNSKLDAMIAFLDQPKKSEFESFLVYVSPYTRRDLLELKAINLLYSYDFAASAKIFDEIKQPSDAKLLADPFLIHINDCHDCDFAALPDKIYTKASFVARLQDLFSQATQQTDKNKAAQTYFELANGLYNMTFYGNARDVHVTPHENFNFSLGRNSNVAKAEEFYRKALELSSDREFKAKAAFMAAKCEQNRFFEAKPEGAEVDFKAGVYFKMLKDEFSDTKYYGEIIKECGYFRTYLGAKSN